MRTSENSVKAKFAEFHSVLKNSLGARFHPKSSTKSTDLGLLEPDLWSVSARRRLFQQAAEFWALGRSFFDGATPAETRRGQELVRERFLLTRLIADELRLYGDLLGTRQPRSAVTKAGLTGEERDPVCGMHLDPEEALEYEYAGRAHRFCSETCRQQFESTPEPFLRAIA